MNLLSIKMFLSRNDVKILIVCTAAGGILQILSKNYIKKNPEIFNALPESKEVIPRGGVTEKVIVAKLIAKTILSFLADHGLTTGLLSGAFVVVGQIPFTAIGTYIDNSLPQNLPHLNRKKFSIVVDGQELILDQCDQSLKYLFKILEDDQIPLQEKRKVARSVINKYLNLTTVTGQCNFVICIVSILYILSNNNYSSFYIMMQNLIAAIRSGKISKAMGRLIVRRLKKKNVLIDPELLDLISS